jgi:cytochrome bd-type quinol oxidase subunit 1
VSPNVVGRDAALLWRVAFLAGFAVLNAWLAWGNWIQWGCILMAVLSLLSALLLWILSPMSRYPLYGLTYYLVVSALIGGIHDYVRNPALLHDPPRIQIIEWLIPGVPSALLVSCCLYAKRLARHGTAKAGNEPQSQCQHRVFGSGSFRAPEAVTLGVILFSLQLCFSEYR